MYRCQRAATRALLLSAASRMAAMSPVCALEDNWVLTYLPEGMYNMRSFEKGSKENYAQTSQRGS